MKYEKAASGEIPEAVFVIDMCYMLRKSRSVFRLFPVTSLRQQLSQILRY